MPIVAMSIEKSLQFQAQEERVSNVYTLDSGVDFNDDWGGVAEAIAGLEASISASDVVARSYTVWNLADAEIDRVIIDAGDINVPGTLPTDSLYKECAYLFRWPLSRSPVLKRRRWLSKWLHTGRSLSGTNAHRSGQAPLTQSEMDNALASYAAPLNNFGTVFPGYSSVVFCDAQGERPGAPFMKPFVEHRQFHRR